MHNYFILVSVRRIFEGRRDSYGFEAEALGAENRSSAPLTWSTKLVVSVTAHIIMMLRATHFQLRLQAPSRGVVVTFKSDYDISV